MRDFFYGLSLAAAGFAAALAAPAAMAQTAPAAHYSVTETKVAKLLDDPAAAEILRKVIPTVYANDLFQTAGRELTLKDIQQYEPERLCQSKCTGW